MRKAYTQDIHMYMYIHTYTYAYIHRCNKTAVLHDAETGKRLCLFSNEVCELFYMCVCRHSLCVHMQTLFICAKHRNDCVFFQMRCVNFFICAYVDILMCAYADLVYMCETRKRLCFFSNEVCDLFYNM